VSHQTLQHLGVIGLHADLIRNLATETEERAAVDALARARDSARAIEGALGDVNRVLTDLLVFSRDLRLNLYEHSIARLVAECVADCRAEAAAAHVTLRENAPASDILAVVDKLKLKQAVTNVVRNAIEASARRGEVTVAVAACDREVEIRARAAGQRRRPHEHPRYRRPPAARLR
jgi:signal transduction histidine kinase